MKLFEEFKLYETLWDKSSELTESFDDKILKDCLSRVTTNAMKYSEPDIDEFGGSVTVKLSEEDLKKALRIGSRGGYSDPSDGITMPAQLVDMVSLEFARGDNTCSILVELSGENEETGESSHDYNDGDIPFVGSKEVTCGSIESDDEYIEFIKTNIIPKADQLAHEIIEETWNEFGFSDYEGITNYATSSGDSDDWGCFD